MLSTLIGIGDVITTDTDLLKICDIGFDTNPIIGGTLVCING